MEKKKAIQKFKLAPKKANQPSSSELEAEASAEESSEAKQKLQLQKNGPAHPKSLPSKERISVGKLLDTAYAPDRKRSQKAAFTRRVETFSLITTLLVSSIAFVFIYAHLWQGWPLVEPVTWYLPFIISAVLSVYCLVKAYNYIFSHNRSVMMAVTGAVVAVGLCYWNLRVIEIVAQPDGFAPNNVFWEATADKDLPMLLAYEINACRGHHTSPNAYTQISMDRYKNEFRARPQSEWKPYFQKHLSAQEMSKTTAVNIDETMRRVSQRMLQERRQTWNDFDSRYRESEPLFKMKRALVLPYSFVLKYL